MATIARLLEETLHTARAAQWSAYRMRFSALRSALDALDGVDDEVRMRLEVLNAAAPEHDPRGYLSELEELRICTAYELDGRRVTDFPSHVDDLRKAVPVYETLPGWQQDITKIRTLEDLPEAARGYLARKGLVALPKGEIDKVMAGAKEMKVLSASDVH